MSGLTVELAFAPGDFVTITVLGVNYRGRVVEVTVKRGGIHLYDVNYVDDRAELQCKVFYSDELTLTADMPAPRLGFMPD